MARPTTIKDALKRWEDKNKVQASEAKDIGLQFQMPPIEKMDNTLSSLIVCENLSLSTNGIGKIVGLNGLKNLKILSLSRNFIKTLNGIEALADCLEQLWISYNFIEKLRGIENMKNLRVLYITHNFINEWNEVAYLKQLPMLEYLNFLGNPLVEDLDESVYVNEMTTRLPKLTKLDDEIIIREEDLL